MFDHRLHGEPAVSPVKGGRHTHLPLGPQAEKNRADSFFVIVNPAAGKRPEAQRAHKICALLRAAGKRAELSLTAGPGDACRLAREAVQAGAGVVVGAGGDGTLQEIGRALEATDVALGNIPAGCCNDFARAVGLLRSDSPERLAAVLIQGLQRAVDLGGVGAHRFLTVATFGFSSVANRFVQGRKRRSRGTLAYLLAVLWMLRSYRAPPAILRGDFGERSGRFLLAAIGNTPFCGGHLPLTPQADFRDGLFQVCLVGDVSRLAVLSALGRLFRGTHLAHSAVETFDTHFLEIETSLEQGWICADGESLCQTPCRLEVRPQALRVVVDFPSGEIDTASMVTP